MASGAHEHDAIASAIADHEARIAALETSTPPIPPEPPTPKPPVERGPITLQPGDDNAVIEDYLVKGQPGGHAFAARGLKGSHIKNVTVRRCTFDGFDFGVLAEWVDGLVLEDVTIPITAYCAFALFSSNDVKIIRPKVDRVWRPGPYPTTGGQQNNAYMVKVDTYATTDPVCDTVEVSDGIFGESLMWQALNAHSGRHLNWLRNQIGPTPRPIFMSTSGQTLEDVHILDNELLGPGTTPGGTTNVQAISYGSVNTIEIDRNRISSKFASTIVNIDKYSGAGRASTNVTLGTNPRVP